ncbi:uncharacterized protein LOC118194277 [Stegodyphus dumicola]|uniref:uncharacterized protein LOC118194277 n=1 Tax=Stegodyphus dumicola TaxID=202533 RepID=UPI0015AE5F5C|nr:uncharacterized protein LOC118194277 [Stegodyphus dumicola]
MLACRMNVSALVFIYFYSLYIIEAIVLREFRCPKKNVPQDKFQNLDCEKQTVSNPDANENILLSNLAKLLDEDFKTDAVEENDNTEVLSTGLNNISEDVFIEGEEKVLKTAILISDMNGFSNLAGEHLSNFTSISFSLSERLLKDSDTGNLSLNINENSTEAAFDLDVSESAIKSETLPVLVSEIHNTSLDINPLFSNPPAPSVTSNFSSAENLVLELTVSGSNEDDKVITQDMENESFLEEVSDTGSEYITQIEINKSANALMHISNFTDELSTNHAMMEENYNPLIDEVFIPGERVLQSNRNLSEEKLISSGDIKVAENNLEYLDELEPFSESATRNSQKMQKEKNATEDLFTKEVNVMTIRPTLAENISETLVVPECPPPGICFFWFLAQDTCAQSSHCHGSRICCKIRCSKTCIEI